MNYTRVTLSNKSPLIVLKIPSMSSVTVAAYLKAGFRFDPVNKPGLAHFTEHMLFSGTKKYPTHRDLAYQVERFGGWHTAFTWIEHQSHEIRLPLKEFEKGVDVLFETLFCSLLKKKEIEIEKGRIQEEILRNKSDPEKALLDYAWQPLFFQDTALARPYSGTINDINRITKTDIDTFIKEYFTPPNTVFLVAGNIQISEAKKLMEKYLKNYPALDEFNTRKDKIKIKKNRNKQIYIFPNKSKVVSIAVGFETVDILNSDHHVIKIIKNMLSRDFGASLPEKLRNEGGLIYSWSAFQDNLSDTGYLVFMTSTSKKNVLKVIQLIIKEFQRIEKGEFSEKEVELAKNNLTGGLSVFVETGSDFIQWYGLQELLTPNSVLHINDQVNIYRRISRNDIIKVAKQYLSLDKILIAVVGEVKENDLKNLLYAREGSNYRPL